MDGYDEREHHEGLEEDDLGPEMYPRNAAVHTESVSQMGRLLLQGYAMLAESCDTCGVRYDRFICMNSYPCVCVCVCVCMCVTCVKCVKLN